MLAGWCACRSILKVYKQAMRSWSGPEEVAVVETKQSLVGKRLSDITTQRVIVGVLLMMFGLQLFELETYNMYDDTSLVKGGLHVLVDTYRSRTNMEQVRTSPPLLSLPLGTLGSNRPPQARAFPALLTWRLLQSRREPNEPS